MRYLLTALAAIALAAGRAPAQPTARIGVDVGKPGARISPRLFGIFFEEINCSGDGGIYPEMVRNRSFEDADRPDQWKLVTDAGARAQLAMTTGWPTGEFNRRGLTLTVAKGRAGIANGGWWGMAFGPGDELTLSFNARATNGATGPITASLECAGCDRAYAQTRVAAIGPRWKRFTAVLRPTAGARDARLVLRAPGPCAISFDMVSLMPRKTFKGHGLRPDLARMLADLRPGFLRFPGGCWVEGDRMALAMRWKTTIGDPALRRTQQNIWGYMSTNGLGYHEYLQLCEDLGCPALFVINCGMSHRENVPLDQMGPYVQDALDALEYALGPATSKWGRLRAKAGHPKPFDLKYLEIGNENGGPADNERYALFYDAIRARYPTLRLIANERVTSRPMQIVDEHYYSTPEWFMQNADKYDSYDRQGPKIFVGEYAVTNGGGQGSLEAAIGEAAFMTGLERNGDIVELASYAPLFVNVNHRAWNPDLIAFDSSRVYGIPGYYVQRLFAANRGDVVLPVSIDQPPSAPVRKPAGAVGVGTWSTQAEYKDLVVTRGGNVVWKSDFSAGNQGWRFGAGDWRVENGALRQMDGGTDRRAWAGDPSWTDYTLSLKARKISGAEGFLIMFHVRDGSRNWWNLGGWGNQRHGVEMGGTFDQKPGRIETGRWYDIRLEVGDTRIRCFLDGALIHDVAYPSVKPLYAVASRIESTGEVVLKAVNASSSAVHTDIDVRGATVPASRATLTVLTSRSPSDENSIENPRAVVPRTKQIAVRGPRLKLTLPACSLTVLRIKAK